MADLLVIAIFLPLLGAATMWVVAPLGRRVVRGVALGVTLLTLFAAGAVTVGFCVDGGSGLYAVKDIDWMGTPTDDVLSIRFSVGLDGLGVWLFALSSLLMVTSVLVSWEAIKQREALFYGMLLLLEFGCLGVFAAQDIILFYVFFEFTLIPLFFLIGIWGSEQRQLAARKFFLFTLSGSVLTFLALLTVVLSNYQNSQQWTFHIPTLVASLQNQPIASGALQVAIFLGLFAGFAIKVPLFPLHTWLPLAHVQAPTAGSVFLAGILLKIGTYGFVRFSIPMLPYATAVCMPWLLWLAVIGILYGALVALAQSDMKRLIAYSSVSHLGYCMLGLFALNLAGIQGGVLQMVNHGISTGALFALVGMLYERYHTREIRQLGGLSRRAPWLAFFMLVFTFSSIGLPGLNGFVGEFLVLLGAFQQTWGAAAVQAGTSTVLPGHLKVVSVLAVLGVVLGAWYMLWFVQRVFFGPLREPTSSDDQPVKDLNWREIGALAPLAVLVVWIGIQPSFFLRRMDSALRPIVNVSQAALVEVYGQPKAIVESNRSTKLDGQASGVMFGD